MGRTLNQVCVLRSAPYPATAMEGNRPRRQGAGGRWRRTEH